jgi:hypothetical protein
VNLSPAPDALREPTIATIGRASAAVLPRIVRSGGASSITCSRVGYSGNKGDAQLVRQGELAHGIFTRANLRGTTRSAALRQRRQCFERRPRTAEMIDQRAERARPDILATDEPQPIDPLRVLEFSRETTLLLQPCCNYAATTAASSLFIAS